MSRAELYLSHHDAGLRLSREEFAEAQYQEPWRYERVEGKLAVMDPPGSEHHGTVTPIRNHLVAYQLAHPEIIADVYQEAWTATESETDRICDIAVYLQQPGEPLPLPQRRPDLAFEILSAGSENRRRDYVEKRSEYERIGVPEYVIVDRFDCRLTVLRLVDGRYEESHLGPNDVYTTPLLPGLEIPLKGILGE